MLMHQSSGDLMETMHELTGKWAIATAVARIGCIFSDKMPMIYGFCLLMVGMVFNFSNRSFTMYWVIELEFHGMALCVIVMLFAFYIASITATLQQLAQQQGNEDETDLDKELLYERCPLVEDMDTAIDLDENKV